MPHFAGMGRLDARERCQHAVENSSRAKNAVAKLQQEQNAENKMRHFGII